MSLVITGCDGRVRRFGGHYECQADEKDIIGIPRKILDTLAECVEGVFVTKAWDSTKHCRRQENEAIQI